MMILHHAYEVLAPMAGHAHPLPQKVQDALATLKAWIQGIGGGVAVIGLMLIAISMFLAHRRPDGAGTFIDKFTSWIIGAIVLGCAAVIVPIFM